VNRATSQAVFGEIELTATQASEQLQGSFHSGKRVEVISLQLPREQEEFSQIQPACI
jgi:hypothetical protein